MYLTRFDSNSCDNGESITFCACKSTQSIPASEISGKLPRKEKEKFGDGDLNFYEVNPEERQ